MTRFRSIAQTFDLYSKFGGRTIPHSWKQSINAVSAKKWVKNPCSLSNTSLSSFSSSSSRKGRHTKNDISSELACVEILSERTNKEQAKEIVKLLSPNTVQELQKARDKVAMLHDEHIVDEKKPVLKKTKLLESPSTPTPEPSKHDLYLTAMNRGIPFIGFGFLDNALLIIAGEAIDETLGLAFGISTMCAAALGNIVSDLAGVGLGTVIEDFCTKLGIPTPNLSSAQRSLRSVRYAGQVGCAIGITIGCFLGMFPLLFINNNKSKASDINTNKKEDGIEDFSSLTTNDSS